MKQARFLYQQYKVLSHLSLMCSRAYSQHHELANFFQIIPQNRTRNSQSQLQDFSLRFFIQTCIICLFRPVPNDQHHVLFSTAVLQRANLCLCKFKLTLIIQYHEHQQAHRKFSSIRAGKTSISWFLSCNCINSTFA